MPELCCSTTEVDENFNTGFSRSTAELSALKHILRQKIWSFRLWSFSSSDLLRSELLCHGKVCGCPHGFSGNLRLHKCLPQKGLHCPCWSCTQRGAKGWRGLWDILPRQPLGFLHCKSSVPGGASLCSCPLLSLWPVAAVEGRLLSWTNLVCRGIDVVFQGNRERREIRLCTEDIFHFPGSATCWRETCELQGQLVEAFPVWDHCMLLHETPWGQYISLCHCDRSTLEALWGKEAVLEVVLQTPALLTHLWSLSEALAGMPHSHCSLTGDWEVKVSASTSSWETNGQSRVIIFSPCCEVLMQCWKLTPSFHPLSPLCIWGRTEHQSYSALIHYKIDF